MGNQANSEWRIANRKKTGTTRYSLFATRSKIPVSDRLRRSTLLSGRAAPLLREVVLVMIMVNHPGLIAAHLDDFANLKFGQPDLDKLRAAVLEVIAHAADADAAALSQALAGRGFGPLGARLAA